MPSISDVSISQITLDIDGLRTVHQLDKPIKFDTFCDRAYYAQPVNSDSKEELMNQLMNQLKGLPVSGAW